MSNVCLSTELKGIADELQFITRVAIPARQRVQGEMSRLETELARRLAIIEVRLRTLRLTNDLHFMDGSNIVKK